MTITANQPDSRRDARNAERRGWRPLVDANVIGATFPIPRRVLAGRLFSNERENLVVVRSQITHIRYMKGLDAGELTVASEIQELHEHALVPHIDVDPVVAPSIAGLTHTLAGMTMRVAGRVTIPLPFSVAPRLCKG